MGNKKLVWVGHESTLHGAERCFLESVTALSNAGHEIHVFLPTSGPLVKELKEQGIDNINILEYPWWIDRGVKFTSKEKSNLLQKILTSTLNLVNAIAQINPDYIITNTIASPCGALAAFILKKKHIWYIHEYGKEDHGFNFIFGTELSCSLINLFSETVLVNSMSVYKKFVKFIHQEKVRIIRYEVRIPEKYIKIAKENSLSSKIFSLIIVGRVSPSKGQKAAVQALDFIVNHKGIKDVKLTILGVSKSPYMKDITKIIEENKLSEFVELKEFSSDPYESMVNNHVLLMCSKNEAFGRVTVEAMKLGLPVIATRVGGSVDIVKDNFNGLFYNPKNYIELANKIIKLKENQELYRQIRSNAFEFGNTNYTMQKHQGYLEEFLR
jgi:glycosyltransferase involved in cell wall biosynthesis